MGQTTTIRSEVEKFMESEKLTLSDVGRRTGLNVGTLSMVITGGRIMAVSQLDRITELMGLHEGYFYELYIEENIAAAQPNWRRLRPFIFRCAELNKLDYIQQITDWLLDSVVYCPVLFEAAEELLQEGKKAAAAILYEGVAVTEHSQHSERLALCQYRLFTIRLGEDQTHNLQVAAQFEPYIERLDEVLQLDALKDLANVYRSLREWDKVDKIAELMGTRGRMHYFAERRQHRRGEDPYSKLSRPLFVYIVYSDLLRGSVCEERGDYEQALEFASRYDDLSWVKERDEDTEHWKRLFQGWAKANFYVSTLFSGDFSVLYDYVDYFETNKDEFLLSLLNIVDAANRSNVNIDDILLRFELEIKSLGEQLEGTVIYSKRFKAERYSRLLSELSKYFLQQGQYKVGFKYLLECLQKSSIISNETIIIKCVGLFESFREYAASETQVAYQILFREVYRNEKNHRFAVSSH
ncbi:helix-turn-helix transcriptional regulator [Paenibacillus sp. P96]|uniref:Helix-turn-helix transcriptional regulator n=1 Tax=Paenibacillus zeirhizosphaerae TaxID=2987519 RepID=A0ABT9FY31_9BACL|nr:helix-turn-helix transcriptional regulator [Paenibacillus sp. P96]MDP4099372.1 helix-turn-helix transcriptional regulator [Paenibacillus sp. P96]